MNQNCAVTCARIRSKCEGWAIRGECDSNPVFMLKTCLEECERIAAPQDTIADVGIPGDKEKDNWSNMNNDYD